MKTKFQKEMRKIRLQLKVHDVTEKEKKRLRKILQEIKERNAQAEQKENT